MDKIVQFVPKQNLQASENLIAFIRLCKEELTVFGADLAWESNHWDNPGVTFGNLDQKTRKLDPDKVMQQPYINFAKAYFRYQQGHNPTKSHTEIPALRCVERAIISINGNANLENINNHVLDQAAIYANENYSKGAAYRIGGELAKIGRFVSEKNLIPGHIDWKNPLQRPTDTVRTGVKAKEQREKKLPEEELLNALADIFASKPSESRDVFTSSTCAMLLCAPSRVSEILTLPVDCEVNQTKRDGVKAYGWRFIPGKGGTPFIKWIPDAMVTIAQEAISRIKLITNEARAIAKWYEDNPTLWYPVENNRRSIIETLELPKDFPFFDIERGLKYSEALFCFKERQLRSDMPPLLDMIWRPTENTVNDDLRSREAKPGYFVPSIFDRHGFNVNGDDRLKANSHQFRHLLNTMAQRGGLSQTEISRWSGRADIKQNRVYDHMSEFELVDMIRTHDNSLILDKPLEELAEQIATKIPMTRQEFNTLAIPTAHVTEYGFCIHDFTMSPCQRFRDCLNCTEQVCINGDRRASRLKERHEIVKNLRDKSEQEIQEGSAGADRWFEVHDLTEKRLTELIGIMEDKSIPDGSIIKLRNENEFSPLRRAVEVKVRKEKDQPVLEDLKILLGGNHG